MLKTILLFALILGTICLVMFTNLGYGKIAYRAEYVNYAQKSGTQLYALAVKYLLYRPPSALRAMSNGGKPLILLEGVAVYICDSSANTLERRAAILKPDSPMFVFEPSVVSWKDTDVALQLSPEPNQTPHATEGPQTYLVQADGTIAKATPSDFLLHAAHHNIAVDPNLNHCRQAAEKDVIKNRVILAMEK
jgi:hypothetical protein